MFKQNNNVNNILDIINGTKGTFYYIWECNI